MIRRRWRVAASALVAAATLSPAWAECDVEALRAVPAADRTGTKHLLELRECLGHRDPNVRDAFAYARYVELLRSGAVSPDTLKTLLADFVFRLSRQARDEDGFEAPFMVLVLAEVARVDRISPFLDEDGRNLLVGTATRYLRGVDDYRGFVDGEGWRHGVAHGADLAMQLSLNPGLTAAQGERLLAAVAAQVAPRSGHSYVFGEPDRLARPVYFLAVHQRVSRDALEAFFSRLGPDDEDPRWVAPYGSEAGLAALHNTRAFARALYVYAATSDAGGAESLAERARRLLDALP